MLKALNNWSLSDTKQDLLGLLGSKAFLSVPHFFLKKKFYFWLHWVLAASLCELSSSCGVGALVAAASLVPGGAGTLGRSGITGCGAQAQLSRSVWALPRSGTEPVSPAVAGRFLTTEPPGKPLPPPLFLDYRK